MDKMIGNSAVFQQVIRAAQMVSATDAPVLILGEKGTGKELLAKEIHRWSRTSEQPFVQLRCTGLSAEELHLACEPNQSGTLFLDEINELSLSAQAKLVSLLEQVWAHSDDQHQTRIIASSAVDLGEEVNQGRFRQDLYLRVQVVPVTIPPLRERRDDIGLLIKHFTQSLAKYHGRKSPRFSVTAKTLLKQYEWPGNVRELHNFCERMVILMAGNQIQPEDLPPEMKRTKGLASDAAFLLPEGGIDLVALEGDIIQQAVTMSGGNRSKAARLLGLTRDTLLYRIQKHGISL